MQFRGILLAALALALLGGAAWWSQRAEEKKQALGTAGGDAPKLSKLKGSDIDHITVRHLGSPETVLQRSGVNDWALKAPQSFHADTDTVSGMTTTLSSLSWDHLVEEKPADLNLFGLSTPSLEVLASDKAGKNQRLLIGDEVPTGGNFFAKLEGDPRVFAIANGTKAALDKTDKDLRDKRLLTFDTEKLNGFHYGALEFAKAGGEWRITKPQAYRADGYQVEELLRKLKEAKLDPAVSDEDAKKANASFATGTPVANMVINSETLQVRKHGADYFARSSITPGTHKVAAEVGAALGKSLDDLRNKKIFDFAFSEPNKVDIKGDGKAFFFSKAGDKWTGNGKNLDAVSIQSLVDRLRDLSAAKFVPGGFTSPSITITVSSNASKRSESVELAKTAAGYIAKRSNEPELYQLETKAVDDLLRAAADVK